MPQAARVLDQRAFPTVLLAGGDDSIRGLLFQNLNGQGCLVLTALTGSQAVEIARVHSRPIHVLLAEDGSEGRTLVATVKRYRPNIQVLFVARCLEECVPGVLPPEGAVSKVQEILDLSRS